VLLVFLVLLPDGRVGIDDQAWSYFSMFASKGFTMKFLALSYTVPRYVWVLSRAGSSYLFRWQPARGHFVLSQGWALQGSFQDRSSCGAIFTTAGNGSFTDFGDEELMR